MKPPLLDKRTRAEVLEQALTLAGRNVPPGWAGYVPDWSVPADQPDPGHRAIQLFSRLMELVVERLNRVPEKNFLAFLDMAGVERFPGAPADVPVTFVVSKQAVLGGVVPEGTQVATTQTKTANARVYETRRAFFATKARLDSLVAVQPTADKVAVLPIPAIPPTAAALEAAVSIAVLGDDSSELHDVAHVLYLGSEALFGRKDAVDISVTVHFTGAPFPRDVRWQRFDKKADAWVNLTAPAVDETVAGQITFGFAALAAADKVKVNGVEDFWLAAHFDGAFAALPITPVVTRIEGVIGLSSLPSATLDGAFHNGSPLDASKPFLPFGPRPVYGDALYLASTVGFAPGNENMTIDFTIRPYRDADLIAQFAGLPAAGMTVRTIARWQYLNAGGQWMNLAEYDHEFRFTVGAGPAFAVSVARISNAPGPNAGEGTFIGTNSTDVAVQFARTGVPVDIGLHELNGIDSHWIRVLLVSENPYGHEGIVTGTGVNTRFIGPLLIPPRIETVSLTYVPPAAPVPITRAQSLNNFEWSDHSSAAAGFVPYRALEDRQVDGVVAFGDAPALYVAFDRPFEPSAFISLFIDLAGPGSALTSPLESGAPGIAWEMWGSGGWQPLDVTDETLDLTTSGTVAFVAPSSAISAKFFLQVELQSKPDAVARWWLRARLASGHFEYPPRVRGVYVNSVTAQNRSTLNELLVGSSNGEPDQTFELVRAPVLAGELWVREAERPTAAELLELEREHAEDRGGGVALEGDALVLDVKQTRAGEPEVWLRWRRVTNLELSGPDSRHYLLDAVTGRVTFGGGLDRNGLIPGIGRNNIVMRGFVTGGGAGANRDTGALAVKELKSSLPFIDRVFNAQAASGGASEWSLEQLMEFGPQSLKTRGRTVTTEDYEWMVRQQFSDVARVRCVPVSAPGSGGTLVFKAGGVTLLIVPWGTDRRPQPSEGLIRKVREFLVQSTLKNIVRDIHVKGPDYVAIDIAAQLVPRRPELASVVLRQAQAAIERFLHPLMGGEDGKGYGFGRPVYLSEVHALLERLDDVDHVVSARFVSAPGADAFAVNGERLASSGAHQITVLAA